MYGLTPVDHDDRNFSPTHRTRWDTALYLTIAAISLVALIYAQVAKQFTSVVGLGLVTIAFGTAWPFVVSVSGTSANTQCDAILSQLTILISVSSIGLWTTESCGLQR